MFGNPLFTLWRISATEHFNTGVTSNLPQRNYEHKNNLADGFTKKHGCHLLVYYEVHDTMENAIMREKQIKAGSRKKKLALIEDMNPDWRDLSDEVQ